MRINNADYIEYLLLRIALWWLKPFCTPETRKGLSLRLTHTEQQALHSVLALCKQLQNDFTEIPMFDLGSGRRTTTLDTGTFAKPQTRSISDFLKKASVRHAWGVLLFRLTRVKQPERVLELGTNLGVSGAYILQALKLNVAPNNKQLITIEGSPHLSERAEEHLSAQASNVNTRVVTGAFQSVLPTILAENDLFDLVFLDGHHEFEATLRYFELIAPHLRSGAWVVFDDLEPWSPTVRKAFREIQKRYPQAPITDLLKMGILVWP